MSDDEILYVCSGADVCDIDCFHKTPHSHIRACDLGCFQPGREGSICNQLEFNLYMDKTHAQELINVISMAAGEGVEYDFTEELTEKLGKFIDGGV